MIVHFEWKNPKEWFTNQCQRSSNLKREEEKTAQHPLYWKQYFKRILIHLSTGWTFIFFLFNSRLSIWIQWLTSSKNKMCSMLPCDVCLFRSFRLFFCPFHFVSFLWESRTFYWCKFTFWPDFFSFLRKPSSIGKCTGEDFIVISSPSFNEL